jgi:hypothetical protein
LTCYKGLYVLGAGAHSVSNGVEYHGEGESVRSGPDIGQLRMQPVVRHLFRRLDERSDLSYLGDEGRRNSTDDTVDDSDRPDDRMFAE